MAKQNNNLKPWEKQEGENSKPYAAFCAYRDMGVNRSLAKTIPLFYGENYSGKTVGKQRQLEVWSSKHEWVKRVEEYDVYLETTERLENEKAIKDMAKRHAQASLLTMSKAVDRIKLIGEKEDNELTPKEALEYLRISAELERKSRGAPDQIIESTGTTTTKHEIVSSPEVLKAANELAKQIAASKKDD